LTYKNLDNLILSITKKGQEIVPFFIYICKQSSLWLYI